MSKIYNETIKKGVDMQDDPELAKEDTERKRPTRKTTYERVIQTDIPKDVKDKFLKARKALGTDETINVEVTIKPEAIQFVMGSLNAYANNVSFTHPAKYENSELLLMEQLIFPANELKTILSINNEGKGFLSAEGLIKFDYNNAKYWIIANES